MKIVVPDRLKPVVEQVRANPRLQAGVVLIGILFLGWLFLLLGDLRQANLADLEAARARLAQVEQLAGQDVWLQRSDESQRMADVLAAEIPDAQSPGLAQAAFQGWLSSIVETQPGPVRLDVQVPVALDEPAGVVRITAEVSGGMAPGDVWQMIHRIESSVSLVTIPLATIRTDGANHRFSLTVQGFYRLPATPPAPAP